MNDECSSDAANGSQALKPPLEVFRIGVSGQSFERLDLCMDFDVAIQNTNGGTAILDSPAERVFGLITDKNDDVVRIAKTVQQMMLHPPCFAHSAGRDDDEGAGSMI